MCEALNEPKRKISYWFFKISALSWSRISLPARKYGTYLPGTLTASPVRGLRPSRAGRYFTEKLPNQRTSTRIPRLRAQTIDRKTMLTASSALRPESIGWRPKTREINSDFVKARIRTPDYFCSSLALSRAPKLVVPALASELTRSRALRASAASLALIESWIERFLRSTLVIRASTS